MQSDRENTCVFATFYFTTVCLYSFFSEVLLKTLPKEPSETFQSLSKTTLASRSVLEGLPRGLSAPFRLPPGLPKDAHDTFLGPPKRNLEAIELGLLFLKSSGGLWDLILASLGTNFGLLF